MKKIFKFSILIIAIFALNINPCFCQAQKQAPPKPAKSIKLSVSLLANKINISDENQEEFIEKINKESTLILDVAKYDINDDNIEAIFTTILAINKKKSLKNLVIINQTYLTKIPEAVTDLEKLETLVLSNNNIQTLPADLTTKLTNLTKINLENNTELTVPQNILNWGEGGDKNLLYNETKTQKEEERKKQEEEERLRKQEEEEERLRKQEEEERKKQEEALKSQIKSLAKKINISNENQEEFIKEIIERLEEELNYLSLDKTEYDINDDNIENIFEIIQKINKKEPIKTLVITNQKNLTKIPEKVTNLTNLTALDLSENNIKQLPEDLIENLTNLTTLSLENNTELTVPKNILNWGEGGDKNLLYNETKTTKEEAATKIQKWFRGQKEREKYLKKRKATKKIQKVFRGYRRRKKDNEKKLNQQIKNLETGNKLNFTKLNELEEEFTQDYLKKIINDKRKELGMKKIEEFKETDENYVGKFLRFARVIGEIDKIRKDSDKVMSLKDLILEVDGIPDGLKVEGKATKKTGPWGLSSISIILTTNQKFLLKKATSFIKTKILGPKTGKLVGKGKGDEFLRKAIKTLDLNELEIKKDIEYLINFKV